MIPNDQQAIIVNESDDIIDNDLNNTPEFPGMRLGDYLKLKNLISDEKLNTAISEQNVTGERLGIILVRNGFIRKKDLITAILETKPEKINSEYLFLSTIPNELFFQHKAMVVADTPETVFIACMEDEFNALNDFSPYFPNKKIEFVNIELDQIDSYLSDLKDTEDVEYTLADSIIRKAFFEDASDIHIMPKSNSFVILFRLLGVRSLVYEGKLDEYLVLVSRIKDMSKMDIAERRIPQDGGFSLELNGKMVDLRVSSTPTVNGETIVIRLLDPDKVQPSLEGLGITRVNEWRLGVSRDSGICIICGVTGSGKTTTLNATIKELDRFGQAIYSLEDPVEYRIPYVNQVNINSLLGLDFARGIKSFMRMDPDIIMLGELRDLETAQNAIRAAETGHMVIATLHTSSIVNAVSRLQGLGVPTYELAPLIRSILVQRLVRVICQQCLGEGCVLCRNKGYIGRTIVSECNYFRNDEEVQRMLNGEIWWPTILEDAINKSSEGITSESEIKRIFGADAFDLSARGVNSSKLSYKG